MARKKNTNLRQDAKHRPLFAPYHVAHMTEKDRPRDKSYKNYKNDYDADEKEYEEYDE